MPQIQNTRVEYVFQASSTAEEEKWWVPGGTSYAQALAQEHSKSNLSKYNVFVNGSIVSNLDAPVREGDKITLQTKNYDSGLAA